MAVTSQLVEWKTFPPFVPDMIFPPEFGNFSKDVTPSFGNVVHASGVQSAFEPFSSVNSKITIDFRRIRLNVVTIPLATEVR